MDLAIQLIALAIQVQPAIINLIQAEQVTDAQLAEWQSSAHQAVRDLAAVIAKKKTEQAA